MTVKELIAQLQTCNPDGYVAYYVDGDPIEVVGAVERKGRKENKSWPNGYRFQILEVCECDTDCVCDSHIVILD